MNEERLSFLFLAFMLLVAGNGLATTSLSMSYFDTIRDIYEWTGTRVSATAAGSGYPVVASSWPEHVGSEGYRLYSYRG
ncbi:hypothetical protein [Sorangium sp. So ce1151]|uniref:hypothetical protein n=1 Tax=Sorangium sp. So ce1151 TaxID=3133332 RepID=UPI003F641A66